MWLFVANPCVVLNGEFVTELYASQYFLKIAWDASGRCYCVTAPRDGVRPMGTRGWPGLASHLQFWDVTPPGQVPAKSPTGRAKFSRKSPAKSPAGRAKLKLKSPANSPTVRAIFVQKSPAKSPTTRAYLHRNPRPSPDPQGPVTLPKSRVSLHESRKKFGCACLSVENFR